ncbi:MAG: class I SAM-dependent methyltransferase [Gemmataceae bacterium]
MERDISPPLKLYTGDSLGPDQFDPHLLATRELLRCPDASKSHREMEPFSRSWFEEIELKRYTRQGEWLPRVLEFSRHRDESLLMIGPGLGTDAIQYDRHGTEVTIGVTDADPAEALRQNFTARGRSVTCVHVDLDRLPFHSHSFDLAYINALHPLYVDLPLVSEELFRVLKPGGKLFGLFPAHFDVRYWRRKFLPLLRFVGTDTLAPGTAPGLSSTELRSLFSRFEKIGLWRRHLRRTELPLIWRLLPISLMQRVMGHVLIVKAFKPISSAMSSNVRAA